MQYDVSLIFFLISNIISLLLNVFTYLFDYSLLFSLLCFPFSVWFCILFIFFLSFKYNISLAARFAAVGGICRFLICIKNASMR